MTKSILREVLADRRGSTIVEFAILSPLLVALMTGLFAVGTQMHDYNALRSVAADVGRITIVEFQKSNHLNSTQIEEIAYATAMRAPYRLSGEQLDIVVEDSTSVVAGAKKLTLRLSYQPFAAIAVYGISPPPLRYTQNVFVPA